MEYLNLIPINLRHRSLRTWLTLMGVIIGVIAIMLLIGLGEGLKDTITQELEMFGAQNIVIMPGSSMFSSISTTSLMGGRLYESDVTRIEGVPGVEFVSRGIIPPPQKIEYKGQELSAPPFGMDANLFQSNAFPQYKIAKGRFYNENERRVALVAYDYTQDIFDKPVDVNSVLVIGGVEYRVVGVLEKIGGMAGDSGDDSSIMIPYQDAKDMAVKAGTMGSDETSMMYVRVEEGFDPAEVSDKIAFQLRAAHKVKEDDFTIITADFIKEQVDTILNLLTLFLGLIASISLVVSAVGVSNTMFTAVLERTKEIGVLKAIGAKNSQIMTMFLTESAMLCGIGGLVGIIISCLIICSFNIISETFELGLSGVIPIWLVLMSFGFSLFIGVVAGIFPAYNASKLNPVLALRYE
ncbi:ABC transporter permease [Candidatus Micrarchaeota archaeon]|nr:ABC transporter permease [Candidatus Micrarchaeota archaeon]